MSARDVLPVLRGGDGGVTRVKDDPILDAVALAIAPGIFEAMEASDQLCIWREDDEAWKTKCANAFVLDGTPAAHGMAFCCYCGLPLVAIDRRCGG